MVLEELLLRRDGLALALAVGRAAVERVGFAGEGTYPVGLPVRF
ncbi:hypothetical protein ACTVZO_33470 [Streptomyces sp. IBSNAI002]